MDIDTRTTVLAAVHTLLAHCDSLDLFEPLLVNQHIDAYLEKQPPDRTFYDPIVVGQWVSHEIINDAAQSDAGM